LGRRLDHPDHRRHSAVDSRHTHARRVHPALPAVPGRDRETVEPAATRGAGANALRASRSGNRAPALGRCEMTTSMSGMILIATLFLFLATGMPIAFALGLAAMGGLFM